MNKKTAGRVLWIAVLIALLIGVFLTSGSHETHGDISEVMRDAVSPPLSSEFS